MPTIPIHYPANGRNVGFAVAPGDGSATHYVFTGAGAGTFAAGNLAAAQVQALAADPDPAFAGRATFTWTPSTGAVPPGDYIVSFHDLDSATLQYLDEWPLTVGGSGAGGAPTASEIRDAIFARTIDGQTLAGLSSLIGSFLAGKMNQLGDPLLDPQVTITYRAMDDSADRIVAVCTASSRTPTLNPGA